MIGSQLTSFQVVACLLIGCSARLDWQFPIESSFEAATRAMQSISHIERPILEKAGKSTASAHLGHGVNAKITYSDDLYRVQSRYGRPAVIGIFGHELGHIRDFAQGFSVDELSADVQGGCVLAILGESQEPFRNFIADESHDSHPPVSERLRAISQGFDVCKVK